MAQWLRIKSRQYNNQLRIAEELFGAMMAHAIEQARAEGKVVVVLHDEIVLKEADLAELDNGGEHKTAEPSK